MVKENKEITFEIFILFKAMFRKNFLFEEGYG